MNSPSCPACGTVHGPQRRYCLACGALVGARAVELEHVTALARDPQRLAAPVAGPATAASVSVWRRPATSVLATLALSVGVAGGFVLEPQISRADRPAVAEAGNLAGAAAPAATAPGQPGAPSVAAPAPDDPGVAPDGDDAPVTGAPDATAGPTGPTPLPSGPVAGDGVAAPSSAPVAAGDDAPATRRRAPAAAPGDAEDGDAETAADGLPSVDHIWVVGIGAPVTAQERGYLGEVLLTRGTELARYTPTATDPADGAAHLVAGRAPAADAETIAGQLGAADRPWRSYAAGAAGCADGPGASPLLRFDTVTGARDCARSVADLSALQRDLDPAGTVPAFSYLALDPALGPEALDAQLRQVVEPIRRSAAFKRAGLIVIVPTAADPIAPTGALVLSPFAAGSTSVSTAVGPYTLLRTFQDLLGLPRLGGAARRDVRPLGRAVLSP